MGGALGGFDEAKQQRMQEIIGEVVGEFAKQFPLKYKDALIEKIKDSFNSGEDEGYQLEECPVPTYTLKSGWLLKRGDVRKNWKRRFFVAKNQADNFVIEYYETEGAEKPKGTINCCGYRVTDFEEDELERLGATSPFGIKLTPWDERRRYWYLTCETDEEKKEWEKIFQNACRKADPPINPDPLIAKAFRYAYRATRYSYGYWGWWSITGTEAEVLGAFVGQVLERELMSDVYANIPNNPARGQAISAIQKIVDSATITAVNAAWNAALQAVESVKESIEKVATDALSPLLEAEARLKNQIVDNVGATVNPIMEDVGSRLCRPVFNRSLRSITTSYEHAIRGFASHLRERVQRIQNAPSTLENEYDNAQREVDYWYSGPMARSNDILYSMYTSDLSAIMDCFVGGYTAYDVYNTTRDDLRTLLHNAFYTFYKYTNEGGNPRVVFADTFRKLVNDAKLYLYNGVKTILRSLITSTVDEKVVGPCTDLVAPLNDVIPGPLKELINIETSLEEVINEIVDNAVGAIVSTGIVDEQRKVDRLLDELLPTLA